MCFGTAMERKVQYHRGGFRGDVRAAPFRPTFLVSVLKIYLLLFVSKEEFCLKNWTSKKVNLQKNAFFLHGQ